jgi:hypothetical protein
MNDSSTLFPMDAIDIRSLAERIRLVVNAEQDANYSQVDVERAIRRLADRYPENFAEALSEPGTPDYRELLSILDEPFLRSHKATPIVATTNEGVVQPELFVEELSDLNGFRRYSPQRYAAMIEHLSFRCQGLLKTKLNKLLFYADFWYFAENGVSMSGAMYRKLPFGPVGDYVRSVVNYLTRKRKLRQIPITAKKIPTDLLAAKKSYDPSQSILEPAEIEMLDQVASAMGTLTSNEISELSHEEFGWKSLRIGETISYHYAKMLKMQPKRS